MTYVCELETGRRTIKTEEEAMKIISTTALTWGMTRFEILTHKKFKDIARAFKLDLTDLKQTVVTSDSGEAEYKFIWTK